MVEARKEYESFNTTTVRFRLSHLGRCRGCNFQHLNGTIQTDTWKELRSSKYSFQHLKGTIQTCSKAASRASLESFQHLKGTIQT